MFGTRYKSLRYEQLIGCMTWTAPPCISVLIRLYHVLSRLEVRGHKNYLRCMVMGCMSSGILNTFYFTVIGKHNEGKGISVYKWSIYKILIHKLVQLIDTTYLSFVPSHLIRGKYINHASSGLLQLFGPRNCSHIKHYVSTLDRVMKVNNTQWATLVIIKTLYNKMQLSRKRRILE